ncbi:MAG TPA: hypothetical protein VM487_15330 [Phycisphaerae bacterium]|nr:hypothetical protein [Phycisphaerae bacterium]
MRARAPARRSLAHSHADGIKGIWLAVFILAILLDLGATGRSAAKSRGCRPAPSAALGQGDRRVGAGLLAHQAT